MQQAFTRCARLLFDADRWSNTKKYRDGRWLWSCFDVTDVDSEMRLESLRSYIADHVENDETVIVTSGVDVSYGTEIGELDDDTPSVSSSIDWDSS